ncbi:Pimeloyl-ACP methyl ester carboxylesterase [Pseudomonas syringae pv. actinidiae]|uniref:Pimeloyl-ACP methyl ester carboxylesterase n=2 Tax=Pseudomonas syringae TaxID=317 RepID=A0AAN4TM51_PSESF|nr:Pimeloyl-ACP methyl ester carboxylesterase [Pseudomonas syringae pv. actinidiae]
MSVSPNILVHQDYEKFPGLQGTGFFCSKNGVLYYVTARHCLTKDNKEDIAKFAAMLRIPFSQSTDSTSVLFSK